MSRSWNENLPTGVVNTNNIDSNGRKKLLVIGKTGTGKSSLCNVICGYDHNARIFPVSAEAATCTQSTQFREVFFNKENEKPVSLIDTIGFDDPDKNDDAKIIAELVDKLKHACDYVNLFVICVNGQNPRLDGSLLGMIRIFEGMFGPDFWKQVVVLFTRMPMDKNNKERREKNSGQTDKQLAMKYMDEVAKRFKNGKNLNYLFLDACYGKDDDDELESFTESMNKLFESLDIADGLPTSKVKEVETKTAALKKQIAAAEEARDTAVQEAAAELKEWQKKEDDAKKRAEQQLVEHQEKINQAEQKVKEAKEEAMEAAKREVEAARRAMEECRVDRQKDRAKEIEELNRMRDRHEEKGYEFGDVSKAVGGAVASAVTSIVTGIGGWFK